MATDDTDDKKVAITDDAATASDTDTRSEAEKEASNEAAVDRIMDKAAAEDAGHVPNTPQGAEAEEHLVAEPDRVNIGMIAAITFAIILSVVPVVIGVQQFTTQTFAGEVNKKVYEPEDPAKKELAAVEAARLHKYQWASQKDGIVRIPVERARELVLADYGKMAAYQPGPAHAAPPASADVPAPGPAPSTTTESSASVAPSASVPGMPSGTPAPSGSVAPEASTLKPGLAPSTSASVPHKH